MNSETKVVPNWIVEYLVTNLFNDLQSRKYISATVQARSILEFSKTTHVPNDVQQLASRSLHILEQKEYTEQNFIMSLNQHMQDAACPEGSIPPKLDGSCEDGYVPLFGGNKKSKCCIKMKKELERMDSENREILQTMHNQGVDTTIRQAFEERFALSSTNDNYKAKNHMLSGDVPDHSRKFIQSTLFAEEKRLNDLLPIAIKKGEGHTLFGMTADLFQYMLSFFKSSAALISWYINHDWSYWWIGIYLFRFLSMFVCMWISLDQAKNFMDELAEQYFGFKPLTLFLVGSWGPLVLAPIIFSSITSMVGNHNIFATIFNGVSNALGSFMSVGFLHFRIMNLLSSYGFLADLSILIRDIFRSTAEFMKVTGRAYSEGKGVMGSLQAGVQGSMSFYCKNPMKSFFDDALKIVQSITVNLFYVICISIRAIFVRGNISEASTTCNALQTLVQKLFSAVRVNTSLQGLVEGKLYGADTPEEVILREKDFQDVSQGFSNFNFNPFQSSASPQ